MFDTDYVERLSTQASHFAREVTRLVKSIGYADALLVLLIASKGKLPDVHGLPLSSLFFAAEAVAIWSSAAFAFLSTNMVNLQAYEALIRQWCAHRHPHDPEYLLASYTPMQLVIRIVRPRLSSPFGADRLRAGTRFVVANWLTLAGLLGLTGGIVVLHMTIIATVVYKISIVQNLGFWATSAISVAVVCLNLFALILYFATTTSLFRLPVNVVDMRHPSTLKPLADNESPYIMTDKAPMDLPNDSAPAPVAEIEKIISEQVAPFSPQEQLMVLKRQLAYARLSNAFERTYRNILGSQMRALRRVAELKEVPVANAREFYQAHAADQHPNEYKDFPFERWLNFLTQEGLVFHFGAKVEITERGLEFIKFLDALKYPDRAL